MGKPKVSITMPDGTERELPEMHFTFNYSLQVSHDGQIKDLGTAYRICLTQRNWATERLDETKTKLADCRSRIQHLGLEEDEGN